MTASPQQPRVSPPARPYLRLETIVFGPPSILRSAAASLALLAVFSVSIEVACRTEDWIQYRTPFLARESSQQDLLIRDALGMHGRPAGRFQKWSLNAFGMRGPEVPLRKGSDVVRIVTAGASETFGLYESPGREYPRQLEDSLNKRLSLGGRGCSATRAEVLNAAMPGMSLPTIEQDIRLRVRPLRPDFVVIYATPPGYLYDSVPVAAPPDSGVAGNSRLPFVHALVPRIVDRLRVQLKQVIPAVVQDAIRRREIQRMLASHPKGWRYDEPPADRLDAFSADLRKTIGSIRAIGAIPVVMTHANRYAGSPNFDMPTLRTWEKFYPRASGKTIVAFDSLARLASIAIARDSQSVLVDLTPILSQTNGTAFADYAHLTDAGAAATAGALTNTIASQSRLAGVGCVASAK